MKFFRLATSFKSQPPSRPQFRFSYRRYLSPGNFIFLGIVFLGFFSVLNAIPSLSRSWELRQRVSSRQRELARLRLEVETLELENQYYLSEEYKELTVRRLQHKKSPGETLIFLPENSIAAKTKHQNRSLPTSPPPSSFEIWLHFLFGD